jgi:predicted DCC family thiol-disulfide oxidoreductase YuxK
VSVTFVDVSQQTDVLSRDGITFDQVRRHMYVRDANGRLHRGTDAFAVLWAAHPRRRWMARAVMLPVIRPIARWSYDRFADMLYNWNRQHKRW